MAVTRRPVAPSSDDRGSDREEKLVQLIRRALVDLDRTAGAPTVGRMSLMVWSVIRTTQLELEQLGIKLDLEEPKDEAGA